MSKPITNNMFLKGIWEPLNLETDLDNPIILGKIPKELNGTFYRNGPNPQYVYSENYHMFEGDGMIHSITLQNGQVRYQNRWIRTEKFLAERTANKALFGGMRDLMAKVDGAVNCSRNTANTNVIWHHNKLLALNEGHLPIDLNREDLIQCEAYTFNNLLDCSMIAHPKIDPVSGELIFYSYFGPEFKYFIADKQGEIIYQTNIAMPFKCMMHDFAITKNFTIFPLFPLTWNIQRLMNKENFFKWEPGLNTRFAIMPRYGNDKDIIWFEDNAALGFHVVNAQENNNKIILDMVVMDEIPNNAVAFTDDSVSYINYFTRWVLDLKSKKITKERLDNLNVEFPRIDERFVGRKQNYAYMNGTLDKNIQHLFDAIIRYDLKNKTKQVHHFGDGSFPLEPIFVPRTVRSPEGEGYLLSYVYRENQKRSDLVILDAQHLDEEPLAIIQLPNRVPFGFHGCWVNNSEENKL